jgi:hypothetical protein
MRIGARQNIAAELVRAAEDAAFAAATAVTP